MKFRRRSIVFSIAVLHISGILVNYTVMFSMKAGIFGFLCSVLLMLAWIHAAVTLRTRKQKHFSFIYWCAEALFCLFIIFSGNEIINAGNLFLAPFWTIFFAPFSGISWLLTGHITFMIIHGFTLLMLVVFTVRRNSAS